MNEFEYDYELADVDEEKPVEENYYSHNRLRKLRKGKADAYRYLEESTDVANPHPSFFATEDETITQMW